MIEREEMGVSNAVAGRESSVPVPVLGFVILVGLFSRCSCIFLVSKPIIFVGCSIYIVCDVVVVVNACSDVKSFCQEMAFAVF